MFNNIGRKIKVLAQVICWIGIVLSVIAGVIIMAVNFAYGLLMMALGSLGSWVGSFLTYGFGQLIENSDILVRQGKSRESAKRDQNSDSDN